MSTLTFTEQSFKEFKRLYENCKPKGVFKFEEHDVLKEYAKYLIQYVESKQEVKSGQAFKRK